MSLEERHSTFSVYPGTKVWRKMGNNRAAANTRPPDFEIELNGTVASNAKTTVSGYVTLFLKVAVPVAFDSKMEYAMDKH